MPTRKPNLILPVVAVVLLLLFLYLGAYWATVEPVDFGDSRPLIMPVYSLPGKDPISSQLEAWAYPFFAPINWLDRRIRPRVWGAE